MVTVSYGKTARLSRCETCRPIEELTVELQRAVGRDLTNKERDRFGVPDWALGTK